MPGTREGLLFASTPRWSLRAGSFARTCYGRRILLGGVNSYAARARRRYKSNSNKPHHCAGEPAPAREVHGTSAKAHLDRNVKLPFVIAEVLNQQNPDLVQREMLWGWAEISGSVHG